MICHFALSHRVAHERGEKSRGTLETVLITQSKNLTIVQWIIEPAGDYHTVINLHFRKYLGYTGQFRGAGAIGVEFPVQWAIIQDEGNPTAVRYSSVNHHSLAPY